MFEETFELKNAIILCYGMQKFVALQQKIPKAQVWAIIEAIIFILNLVIFICVMNHNRGHWLLSDALTTAITLTMEMEAQLLKLFVGLEIFDLFKANICLLHKNMHLDVIKAIKHFLEFQRSFDVRQVHKHDGYHVGSPFQSIMHSGKLGGTQECILINI
jgi:hypothetical protein